MICGLVMAAAFAGQTLVVGTLDGGGQSVPIATNAAHLGSFFSLLADSVAAAEAGGASLPSIPVQVGALASGTQVRVLRTVKYLDGDDEHQKFSEAYVARVVDGVFAGAKVVIGARFTRASGGFQRRPAQPLTAAKDSDVEVTLGARGDKGEAVGAFVGSSADELSAYWSKLDAVDLDKEEIADPVSIGLISFGTRARQLGKTWLTIDEGGKPTKRGAFIVKIADGPAKGCVVVARSCDVLDLDRSPDVGGAVKPSSSPPDAYSRDDARTSVKSSEDEFRKTAAKQKARRSARVRAGRAREADEADAQARAAAEYKAALPYLLEAQRNQLEAMSQAQRSAALQRMAAADERMARAMEYSSGMPRTVTPPPYGQVLNPYPVQP